MKPYYEESGITLYNCDCLELVESLDEDTAIVTDPPYGINYVHGSNDDDKNPTKFNGVKVIGDDKPFDPSHLLRFKTAILWGANHYASRLPDSRGWLIWDKRCNTVVNDQSDAELAWTKGCGQTARIFYHVWDGFRRQTEKNVPRTHPTQKPVDLLQWCLMKIDPKTVIADLYAGTGSTVIAAKNLGRKIIACEIDEKYCQEIVKRLRQEVFSFG